MKISNKKEYKEVEFFELVEMAQKDDYDAIEEIIKREQKNVYALFYFLDATRKDLNDLTQEALLKMAKNIKSLKNPKAFKGWFNQIITNIFYDSLRKNKRQLKVTSIDTYFNMNDLSSSSAYHIEDTQKTPAEHSLSNELDDVIKAAIHKLPDSYRLAIVLREFQGLSYEEIAEITKSNIGTVKSRIARARNKLKEILKHYIS